jgi:hypothetical protein
LDRLAVRVVGVNIQAGQRSDVAEGVVGRLQAGNAVPHFAKAEWPSLGQNDSTMEKMYSLYFFKPPSNDEKPLCSAQNKKPSSAPPYPFWNKAAKR